MRQQVMYMPRKYHDDNYDNYENDSDYDDHNEYVGEDDVEVMIIIMIRAVDVICNDIY